MRLHEALKAEGVVYGVLSEAVDAVLAAQTLDPVVVARGKTALDGQDARVEWHAGKEGAALAESDAVDHRTQNSITMVEAGQVIAKKVPPVPGREGKTVTGVALAPECEGRDEVSVRAGENIDVSEDGLEFSAAVDGHLLREGTSISIRELLKVGDVGFGTGNLDCACDVMISGGVGQSFEVRGGKNILIKGSIEDAVVESNGSVDVGGGILHRAVGKVIAGGRVSAKYAQGARIRALGSIYLNDSALHSDLLAGKSITILKGKGALVGGHAQAGGRIEVKRLGCRANVRTVVQVGTDYREVREALEELAETRKSLRAGGTATDKDWKELEARKKSLEANAAEILESFALTGAKRRGSVKVALRAYPGVEVIIGDASLVLKTEYNGGEFRLNPKTNTIVYSGKSVGSDEGDEARYRSTEEPRSPLMNAVLGGLAIALVFLVVLPSSSTGSRHWYRGGDYGNAPRSNSIGGELQRASEMIRKVNAMRRSAGVKPLVYSRQASSAGRMHCEDMSAREYLDLKSPEGFTVVDRLDVVDIASSQLVVHEIVSRGPSRARRVLSGWTRERKIITNPVFTRIGVGVRVPRAGAKPGSSDADGWWSLVLVSAPDDVEWID
jgi:hypothetical protein